MNQPQTTRTNTDEHSSGSVCRPASGAARVYPWQKLTHYLRVLAGEQAGEYTEDAGRRESHRGPVPVQSQPANRVRAGRQQR
jgi:hypothetical protein